MRGERGSVTVCMRGERDSVHERRERGGVHERREGQCMRGERDGGRSHASIHTSVEEGKKKSSLYNKGTGRMGLGRVGRGGGGGGTFYPDTCPWVIYAVWKKSQLQLWN